MISWCNEKFTHKGRALLFRSWCKSGILWVKDLFQNNGNFLSEQELCNRLKNKANWIAEYSMIKRVVLSNSLCTISNMCLSQYVNIFPSQILLIVNNTKHVVREQKCRFFYELLLNIKGERSYMERVWEHEFKTPFTYTQWRNLYLIRVHKLPNKLSDFMYKMIHNLILCRKTLKKWKRVVNDYCPMCKKCENVKHIYYECKRISDIWKCIGDILEIKITWKKIVVGYSDDNIHCYFRNLIFSIILYAIFKFWMNGLEEENKYISGSLIKYIKIEISKWNNIIFSVTPYKDYLKNTNKMWNKLINM